MDVRYVIFRYTNIILGFVKIIQLQIYITLHYKLHLVHGGITKKKIEIFKYQIIEYQ
jgi:hypothetical protein